MDFRLSTGRWPKSTVLGVVCAVVLALAPVVSAGAAEDGNALKARLAARSLLLDIAAADGHLVAVGERGHILFSDDRGATWTQADVPTTVTLTGVFLLDRNLGWAVGHDAVVLHTADGSRTWTLQRSAPEEERPLFDVYFSDAAHGFAIGAYGAFLATADGGATWTERRISEEDVHLHHIARAPSGALFIAAESGTLFRSDDGGASWRELPSPYEGSLFATVPLEGKALLLLGLRGHLFRSEDGGESWTALASGTEAMLTDGVVLGDGRVVVTGLAGVVLVSEDHGRTFAVHHQPARQGIVAVAPAGDGAIALAGEFGVRKLPAGALAETSR